MNVVLSSTQMICWPRLHSGKLGPFHSFPTSCSYPQCLCRNVYSTNETKNHRMILAMWEKRKGHAMTPFQRRWLYPMAWRRLNKYLPGYLLCFFTSCSMLEFLFKPQKSTIHIISFSIAVAVPRKALMLRRP